MEKKSNKKTNEKTLSTSPLKTDEILKAALDTKPPKKKTKDKGDGDKNKAGI